MANKPAKVIIPVRGGISFCVYGILEYVWPSDSFHIPGNPAVVFNADDVASIEGNDDEVIRLKD